MALVIDTSAVIAVVGDEPHKPRLLELTSHQELFAPSSLPWEVCNAFSAMFKRKKTDLATALTALALFRSIPITFADVPLDEVVRICASLDVYAYDACMIVYAQRANLPRLTLDRGLHDAARRAGVRIIEVDL